MGGEVGLVSIRWWELAAQIINTIILFLALRHFLFTPVTKFMQGRKNAIAKNIEGAEKTKQEAEELKAMYQQKIDTAKDEAKQVIRDATSKGESRRQEIIREAQQEADKILEKAKVEISRERTKAMDELKDDMVEISLAAASMVIQRNLDDKTQEKLIQDYIEEMGDVHV